MAGLSRQNNTIGWKMKKFLTVLTGAMLVLTNNAFSQTLAGSGTSTTSLEIECTCTMGNDAVLFTNTLRNLDPSDWDESSALTFACTSGATYTIGAKRETGVNDSIQLVDSAGLEIPYSFLANGVSVHSTTLVAVQTGTASGLSTFINIPVAINVAAAAIADAEPSTYVNVASLEVYLTGGGCGTKSLYE
jgi:hypothetical protein